MEELLNFYRSLPSANSSLSCQNMAFLTNYIFGSQDELLYTPGQIWPKQVGLLASGVLTHNDTTDTNKVTKLAQALTQGFTVSSVITTDDKHRPATAAELTTIFKAANVQEARFMDSATKSEIKGTKVDERGFTDWKSTADVFIQSWLSKDEDWRRAVSEAATKVENRRDWTDNSGWSSAPGGMQIEYFPKTEYDKGKGVSEWLKTGELRRDCMYAI